MTHRELFHRNYDLWLQDCLAEYNKRFSEKRLYVCIPEGEYNTWDVVEFSEAGDAYPHGIGGTNHIKDCVTPWGDSPHFVE